MELFNVSYGTEQLWYNRLNAHITLYNEKLALYGLSHYRVNGTMYTKCPPISQTPRPGVMGNLSHFEIIATLWDKDDGGNWKDGWISRNCWLTNTNPNLICYHDYAPNPNRPTSEIQMKPLYHLSWNSSMLNIRKITVVILLRYTAKPTTKPLPVLIIIIPYHQAYLRQLVVLACICILVQRSQRDQWRQTGARDVTALAAGDWRES